MVSDTSARPSAGRDEVPAKMTSSIFCERSARGPWAPSTQVTASTTLDFPLPLGPTTTVMPGSNSSTVGSANDLKPFMRERLQEHRAHPTNRPRRLRGPFGRRRGRCRRTPSQLGPSTARSRSGSAIGASDLAVLAEVGRAAAAP